MSQVAGVRRVVIPGLLVLLAGCSSDQPTLPPTFQHTFGAGATPWTHDDFDDSEDKFTFAIFSDLNGGERERVFEVALAQLALLRPELILSVGDLIEDLFDPSYLAGRFLGGENPGSHE